MKYTQHENWEEYSADFAERFTLEDNYVICGAGTGLDVLIWLFPEIKILYCLDARAAELPTREWDLLPYEVLRERETGSQKFIITARVENYVDIKCTLVNYGVPAENICILREILFFWSKQYRQKLFTFDSNVILLTNCNLRCKACAALLPYVKHHRYNSVQSVIENLEQYFRIYDCVGEMILMGGEPMLYKELEQVCSYIRTHFQGRFYWLRILTNGLITPNEAVIEELSKLDHAQVRISDYRCSIEKAPNKLIEYLEKYKVPYVVTNTFGHQAKDNWFDLGDPAVRKDGNVRERFSKCPWYCPALTGRKIYYCGTSCFNTVGRITELERPEVCLDLNALEQLQPEERAEQIGKFELGFIDNGYLEFCRFCNGMGPDVNTRYVRAGEQC